MPGLGRALGGVVRATQPCSWSLEPRMPGGADAAGRSGPGPEGGTRERGALLPFCLLTQAVADFDERPVEGAFTRVGCSREQGADPGLQPMLPPSHVAPGQPLLTLGWCSPGLAGARPTCRAAQRVRASLGQNKGPGCGRAGRRARTWREFSQGSVYGNGREELSVETLTQPALSRVGAGAGLGRDRDREGPGRRESQEPRGKDRQTGSTHTASHAHACAHAQHRLGSPSPLRSPQAGSPVGNKSSHMRPSLPASQAPRGSNMLLLQAPASWVLL